MKCLLFSIIALAGLAMQASAAPRPDPMRMDTDQDGKVSWVEYRDNRMKETGKSGKQYVAALRKRFKVRDKDQDGFLSVDELGPMKKKGARKAEDTSAETSSVANTDTDLDSEE